MDKVTSIKIKNQDGTYSNEIPIKPDIKDISYSDEYSLKDIIGKIDFNNNGSIQSQLAGLSWQKAEKNDVLLLKERINNIIANNGSGDISQLIDIRSGADGVVYNTAGEAINTQLENLSERIDNVQQPAMMGSNINLIKYPYVNQSKTISGVTFVTRSDGSILVNGTATAAINFIINDSLTLLNKTYKLTGCPTGGNSKTYRLRVRKQVDSSSIAIDYGKGNQFTVSNEEDLLTDVGIYIAKKATVSNVIFYPMLYVFENNVSYDYIPPSTARDEQARLLIQKLEARIAALEAK